MINSLNSLPREERIKRVEKFQVEAALAGMKMLAPYVFELKGPFTKTLVISTLVHGNEIGGIEVLLKLIEEIYAKKLIPKSNLRFILGNVDAYFEDKRFLESDMNRSFGLENPATKEELRANELEGFLKDADILIDIHQTIGPTKNPFYIFEYDEGSCNLARFLHPTLPMITYKTKRQFKGKTSTGYFISQNGHAVTIETGQKSIEETQISLGLELTRKVIETDFTISLPSFPLTNTYTFSQVISNPDGSLELVKTHQNFGPVAKGELLAKNKDKEIHSETDGVILFPKYGDYAKVSPELALILKTVQTAEDLN